MNREYPIVEQNAEMSSGRGLVSKEQEWRRPYALIAAGAAPTGLLASRWTDSSADAERLNSKIEAEYYTVAVALKRTSADLKSSTGGTHSGTIPSGAVQLAGRGESIQAKFRTPCDFLHVHVGAGFLLECRQDSGEKHREERVRLADPFFRHDAILEKLAHALLGADAMNEPFARLYADGLSVAIAFHLLEVYSSVAAHQAKKSVPALAKWRLVRATEYIESNLASTISLADLAAVAQLSRMHFAAQFRVATGMPPHEYVLSRRVERAKELLSRPGCRLVDVALSVGFQTQAHFSTVFRRFVGDTPNALRRRSIGVGS